MLVINADNVNDALTQGIAIMCEHGEPLNSRAGQTLEIPMPVATVYRKPWERVLISRVRDANPFFHLMESLWILAGRKDVKFLSEFNKRMSEYSDDGKVFNAPYGYRLRNGIGYDNDQLATVIRTLKNDPNSRQAVCQIWDEEDLHRQTKDKACNMQIVFRIRSGYLYMTVNNRSNDMVWGAYGANVVQFSMIQEYVAAHLGLPLGTYTQVSNSFHVYTEGPGGEVWDRLINNFELHESPYDNVNNATYMVEEDMDDFEYDLKQFFNIYDEFGLKELGEMNCWKSRYFNGLILPVLCCYLVHKSSGANHAINYLTHIVADDWHFACRDWLLNRVKSL